MVEYRLDVVYPIATVLVLQGGKLQTKPGCLWWHNGRDWREETSLNLGLFVCVLEPSHMLPFLSFLVLYE